MATKTAPKGQEKTQSKRDTDRVVTNNRRAFHDYFISIDARNAFFPHPDHTAVHPLIDTVAGSVLVVDIER